MRSKTKRGQAETPDLASVNEKAGLEGVVWGRSPMASIMRQMGIVASSTSHPLCPWSSRKPTPMGKKEHLVVDIIIALISEMGMPALINVE